MKEVDYQNALQIELLKAKKRESHQLRMLFIFSVLAILIMFSFLYFAISEMESQYKEEVAKFKSDLKVSSDILKSEIKDVNSSAQYLETKVHSITGSAFMQIEKRIDDVSEKQLELESLLSELKEKSQSEDVVDK